MPLDKKSIKTKNGKLADWDTKQQNRNQFQTTQISEKPTEMHPKQSQMHPEKKNQRQLLQTQIKRELSKSLKPLKHDQAENGSKQTT